MIDTILQNPQEKIVVEIDENKRLKIKLKVMRLKKVGLALRPLVIYTLQYNSSQPNLHINSGSKSYQNNWIQKH